LAIRTIKAHCRACFFAALPYDDPFATRDGHFHAPCRIKGIDRLLKAGAYKVVTDEELIEGLSFPSYRRVATMMMVPGAPPHTTSMEMIAIAAADLGRRERAGMPSRDNSLTHSMFPRTIDPETFICVRRNGRSHLTDISMQNLASRHGQAEESAGSASRPAGNTHRSAALSSAGLTPATMTRRRRFSNSIRRSSWPSGSLKLRDQ